MTHTNVVDAKVTMSPNSTPEAWVGSTGFVPEPRPSVSPPVLASLFMGADAIVGTRIREVIDTLCHW